MILATSSLRNPQHKSPLANPHRLACGILNAGKHAFPSVGRHFSKASERRKFRFKTDEFFEENPAQDAPPPCFHGLENTFRKIVMENRGICYTVTV
ncbi:MAG: hypothetical protein LAT83_02680 [Kiritimatiellae bacterium]|nr:hypothetical protein [Kiritimatiellia bacterium]